MIASNQELEYKFLLSQDDFYNLQSYFSKNYVGSNIIQTNYYFDTDDLSLLKKGITLRLRNTHENYELTIKKKMQTDNMTRSEEKTIVIDKETAFKILLQSQIPKELHIYIENNNLTDYRLLGSLTTLRTKFNMDNFIVCLDKNIFLSKVDYEVEIEIKSEEDFPVEKILNKVLQNAKDTLVSSVGNGKYSRFITSLTSLCKEI
ncbi:hypothetical protein GTHT12_03710 (plasmid) [Geobacillus thermodenitrificans]|uniref:CYTH domain-containing protein n=1 Tax=Geobacillus thermodenitrificans TaxID=33940 RepID=UPI000A2943D9|nr:CYTH domain-containing protein [Geobacillus thermodenitrificans]ARP44579.1 hypothetical protein GTHT12_03710 [Geobacillus thermodenitrificans]